jgi:hypothetical protein
MIQGNKDSIRNHNNNKVKVKKAIQKRAKAKMIALRINCNTLETQEHNKKAMIM